jgi:putative nucleotidyltransferase with HDIG domain
MIRVLFVDDEDAVLAGLRNLLRRYRKVWDMAFVDSGEAALSAMREQPFDVVISDMRMPGMDGAELLGKVLEEWPEAVRIILSGHAEPDAAFRAVSVAQQFLNKPCEPGTVESVIDQAIALRDLLQDRAVMEIVGRIDSLPAMPRVYKELSDVLSDPNTGVKEVTAVVEEDVGISARVLQLSNSGFFSPRRPITDVEIAISRMGFQTVRSLAMSHELFHETEVTPDLVEFMEELHRHSLIAANLARLCCVEDVDKDTAFLAGMLHDVGKLVLASGCPEAFLEAREMESTGDYDSISAEREVLGTTHAEVGAYLLGLWGLHFPVVEAVAHHHEPQRMEVSDPGLLLSVHVANGLAQGNLEMIDAAFVASLDAEAAFLEWKDLEAARLSGPAEAA